MNKTKIAIALASGLLLSSAASADTDPVWKAGNGNQIVNAEVGVSAYVAAGLSHSAEPMKFGAVVHNTGKLASVEVKCNGDVTYSDGASPAGATADGTQNFGAVDKDKPKVGYFTIRGEKSYAINVSVAAADGTPTGVTFTPKLTEDCGGSTVGSAAHNTALGINGELKLTLYGKLEISKGFDMNGGKEINTNAVVNVNYR